MKDKNKISGDGVTIKSVMEEKVTTITIDCDKYADEKIIKVLNHFRKEYGIATSAQKLYENFKNETQ